MTKLTAAFERTLAVFGFDRDVTVDDVRALRFQTELTENAVKHFLIFQHIVIRIFYFFMCLFSARK